MADLPLDQLPEKVSPEAEDLLYLVDSAAPQGTGDAKVKVGSLPQPVTDHGALTGLTDDDHPQYHTDARGDARYDPIGAGIAAVEAHETLPDPHPQYHTDARGDARYDAVGSAAAAEAAASAELVNHEAALDPHAAAAYLQSVVAGTNVTVDDTDPRNPVVSATASGGGTSGSTVVYEQVFSTDYAGDIIIPVDGLDQIEVVLSAEVGTNSVFIQLSFDGGATYLEASGDYQWLSAHSRNSAVYGQDRTNTDALFLSTTEWTSVGGLSFGNIVGLGPGSKASAGFVFSGKDSYSRTGVNSSIQAAGATDQVTHIKIFSANIAAGSKLRVINPLAASGIQEGADNEVAGVKVSVVAALPGTPDADTLYFVTG